MEYRPFAHPPNYAIASIHSDTTRPGREDETASVCPCCQKLPCIPHPNWLTRDVDADYGKQGGAFSTYFLLLRFYSAAILMIILVYSAFMTYQIYTYCENQDTAAVCVKGFGVWIVSFRDLVMLMQNRHDSAVDGINKDLTILYVLRSFVFVALLFLNSYLLYIVQKRSLTEDKAGFESYAVLLRNIDVTWKEHDLRQELSRKCPGYRIHQLFFLDETDEYKRCFDSRNEAYFQLKCATSEKQRVRLTALLEDFQRKLEKAGQLLTVNTGKAIVVLTTIQGRNQVAKRYSGNLFHRILKIIGFTVKDALYAQGISRPEEIYWNYIGESSRKKLAMIVLEYITIAITLALSYLFLSNGLRISESKSVSREVGFNDELLVMGVAIAVVVLGICFRKLMCKIAEWRKPNTRTAKAMFIVSTSILFHLIYYAIIPTIYFTTYKQEKKSLKLLGVGVQVLFFLLIQFLLSAFDVFFCMWNRRKNRILSQGIPWVWQSKLQNMLEYPSFPLEFKLMLLFKSWTFVLFYAFEAPYILGLVLVLFLYLYFSDKHNLYYHYRREAVSSRVEYIFLRIYSNFFTVFLCFLYCWSQYHPYELAAAVGLSFFAICFQIFYSPKNSARDECRGIDQLPGNGYRYYYEKYLQEISSEALEQEVRTYIQEKTQPPEKSKSLNDREQAARKRGDDSLLISESVADISAHLMH